MLLTSEPVLELAGGIQEKEEFQSVLSQAVNTQARLKTLHDKQENTIKQLQETRKEITSTFQDMRERFNQILDKVEKDSTTQMNSLLTMLKEQVTLDKEVCLYFHDKIKK